MSYITVSKEQWKKAVATANDAVDCTQNEGTGEETVRDILRTLGWDEVLIR